MNVFSYIRVSGKSQIAGDGPDRQRDSIKYFCDSQKLNLLGEKFEKGVSGTVDVMDRPAFREILDEVESRRRAKGEVVDAIVVERADRLARDLMISEMLLKECRERNLKVFSADRGALIDIASDGSDPTQVLIRQVISAISQWEKTMLVLKLKKARDRIKAATGKCGGAWRYDEKPEGRTLLAIFDNLDTGTLSLRGLARLLNDGGIRTFKGSIWRAPDVSDMRKRVKKLKENNLWHGRIVIQ